MNYKHLQGLVAFAEGRIEMTEKATSAPRDYRDAVIQENKGFIKALKTLIELDFEYWFDQLIEVSSKVHSQMWEKATPYAREQLILQLRQQWEKSDLPVLITRIGELKAKIRK